MLGDSDSYLFVSVIISKPSQEVSLHPLNFSFHSCWYPSVPNHHWPSSVVTLDNWPQVFKLTVTTSTLCSFPVKPFSLSFTDMYSVLLILTFILTHLPPTLTTDHSVNCEYQRAKTLLPDLIHPSSLQKKKKGFRDNHFCVCNFLFFIVRQQKQPMLSWPTGWTWKK